MDLRLTKAMRAAIRAAYEGSGKVHLFGDETAVLDAALIAAVDLWCAGAIELVACGQRLATFRLTADGEEMARVVCAA